MVELPMLEEDHEKISRFSQLNAQRKEHLIKSQKLKEDIQKLEDASEEIILNMGDKDSLLLQVGECFVTSFDDDKIAEAVQERLDNAKEELQNTSSRLDAVVSEMEELKAALYAKLGQHKINLEFADDDMEQLLNTA